MEKPWKEVCLDGEYEQQPHKRTIHMAKIDEGCVGGFRGKLGPVVGYQWRGQWCVRSLPGRVHNPRTEEQQRHRMMFKQEVLLASRMNRVLRKTFGNSSLEQHMTAGNLFVKRNQEAFGWHDGELSVDWGALVLSEGPVAPVRFGVPHVDAYNTLTVSFEKNPLHTRADSYDRVWLYLFCPEVGRGFLTAPVYRYSGSLSVMLPDLFAGREVHLWGLVQGQGDRWSNSLYIGFGPLVETSETEEVQTVTSDDSPSAAPTGATAAPLSLSDTTGAWGDGAAAGEYP